MRREAGIGIIATAASAAWVAARPPNIVLILADDQGYNDVGCYGSPLIKTPRLDRMAAEGIRFTDFYAAAPVCTPCRAGLLTGCYPQRVGMMLFHGTAGARMGKIDHVLFPGMEEGLNPAEVIIPEVLKSKGYASKCIGKWHLGDAPEFLPVHQGFDSYFGIPYSNDMKPLVYLRDDKPAGEPVVMEQITQRYTAEAVKFIQENKDRPFFLYLAHNMPHFPIAASEKFKGKSAGGLYGDVIEELDASTGVILDTLKDQKLDDQTLVIYTSDNGPWHIKGEDGGSATPLRAGKGTTYEGGMREPCIMRYPGVIPAGSVCHEVASVIDFLPTFAHLAEAPLSADRVIDGKDMSALMRGEAPGTPLHEAFYYFADAHLNAVRSGKWKLKLETTLQEETKYGKIDNPETKISMKLYNLEVDPGEQKSVLENHPDVVERLSKLAREAQEDMGDERAGIVGKRARPVGRLPGS